MGTTVSPLSGLVATISIAYINSHPAEVKAMTKHDRDALWILAYGVPCSY